MLHDFNPEEQLLKCNPLWELPVIGLGLVGADSNQARYLYHVVFRHRKADSKTRAAALTIFTFQCPSMRFNDASGNGQSHSRPFGFSREEWLEQLLGNPGRKTRAMVAYLDNYFSGRIRVTSDDETPRVWTIQRHRFKRVEREIEHYL